MKSGILAVAAIGLVVLPVAVSAQGMDGAMGPGGMMPDFETLDSDGDGALTKAEISAFRQAHVAGADADKDGRIDQDELVAHMSARMADHVQAMAKARIEAQDLDGDGALTVEEMLAMPVPNRMFGRADADKDGAVSQEEFDQMRDRMHARRADGRGHGRGEHGWSWWGWGGGN